MGRQFLRKKAFDTVEWSFIEKTLQFYGFGPSLQKWIKAFYCDISSAVTKKCNGTPIFKKMLWFSLFWNACDQSLTLANREFTIIKDSHLSIHSGMVIY
jgi:hypothetical protein